MKNPSRYTPVDLGIGLVIVLCFAHVFTSEPMENQAGAGTVTWEPIAPPGPLDLQDVEKRSPTNPDAAAELRFIQTRDPKTNTIPIERLLAANRAAAAFKPGGQFGPVQGRLSP